MSQEFMETGDGSHSLYVKELDEHYHSRHGAIQEAMHVFIEHGMVYASKNELRILEIGFGTGLNALLTWLNAGERQIDYVSIEKYPVDQDIWLKLNYPELLDETFARDRFNALHEAEWGRSVPLDDRFTLTKIKEDFRRFSVDGHFDVIFFDAFAPDVQPALWSNEVLEHMFRLTKPGGVLTTYSAKGDVRRGLTSVGYEVERLEGPPGKKHMTRATRPLLTE